MPKKEKPLALMRADNGDWWLHPPAGSIKKGAVPTLASGPSRMIGGKWERPNENDYHVARLMWVHHQSQVGKADADD